MLETEAKLRIQKEIRNGQFDLVWSYILDFENNKNPYRERRYLINDFKKYAIEDVEENSELKDISRLILDRGIHQMDALHIACAIITGCTYFLTTDDRILKKSLLFNELNIVDSVSFIKAEVSK